LVNIFGGNQERYFSMYCLFMEVTSIKLKIKNKTKIREIILVWKEYAAIRKEKSLVRKEYYLLGKSSSIFESLIKNNMNKKSVIKADQIKNLDDLITSPESDFYLEDVVKTKIDSFSPSINLFFNVDITAEDVSTVEAAIKIWIVGVRIKKEFDIRDVKRHLLISHTIENGTLQNVISIYFEGVNVVEHNPLTAFLNVDVTKTEAVFPKWEEWKEVDGTWMTCGTINVPKNLIPNSLGIKELNSILRDDLSFIYGNSHSEISINGIQKSESEAKVELCFCRIDHDYKPHSIKSFLQNCIEKVSSEGDVENSLGRISAYKKALAFLN